MSEKIIGIDLGTSNSAAAVYINGNVKVIPSAEGNTMYGKAFPSYVAFTKDGQLLVGEPARRQALTNPEGTVYAFKRKMGTDYKYKIYGKEYTPQQLSAFLLQKIKRDAEAYLGEEIKKAVITVPAYFNDNQRQATKDAGEIAGLEVVRIINEPTAAALAYGIDKSEEELKIMVFDFGGGTLDVTIMEYGSGVFEVISTAGDTQLGGTDMDNAIIDYIAEEFKRENGVDLRNDKNAFIRLKEAAEKAKIELSSVLQTDINLPYITIVNGEPKHLNITLTRAKLEELVRPIVEKSGKSIDAALKNAGLNKSDIDKIILVGGPTRMPIVQKFVEDYMGKKIERGIDPMECVATGAAIQGAVLAGEVKDIVLLDVTPLTLGVEVLGGLVEPIIPANTTIPVRKSKIFTTAADNQTTVTIHVVQGERPMAKDNVSLGMFNLTGIPPAPRGVPQIEVTFDIDANGILHVSAKDLGTGKETGITISASTKLSKDEIEKMKKEAEKFAEEDRRRREEIENRNKLEQLVYASERSLEEYGDKIPSDVKSEIEEEIKKAKKVLEEGNGDKIKEELEVLSKKIEKIGTAMYQQAQQAQQGQQQASWKHSGEGKDERIHDTSYEEK
ncbi:molecular chaperone DnaK [Candidatus Aciduliprofundum boonei]|uniref:Chaperone protein DnaK n=1 Tax=Aciduliprofundum boonei (strain DSM 19572 / T469) TaxID=439481 RepID=B5ICS3_ACIB4|nr:molecular chaperone DnaK [Candidatus Aciduliprofundum boonei]ADD09156.1 chaperone protein DnaK [Aciduliprofundum boonei T469]EDY35963.1 chaperone protein DnaK [Aciduliprofundum boonei T469]HII55878.1 molecular chaperone DnaK [Candidatus Aciduliprofundum boonei]